MSVEISLTTAKLLEYCGVERRRDTGGCVGVREGDRYEGVWGGEGVGGRGRGRER